MGSVERVALGIVAIAMVTTLILPGRQTASVARAVGGAFSGSIESAMGR